tara:strand:+ start:2013 stop:3140 length:1128 start_codon:yes stop_codon:yes gene_type:complete
MSEQDLKTEDQEVVEESQVELDEFKASMGDPSEVPEPTSTKAAAPGPSKDQGEKSTPMQGSSEKPKKPIMAGTKMGMINAMVKKMSRMSKNDIQSTYGNMMSGMKPKMEEAEADGESISETSYKVTPEDIDIKADVKALFGNEELSEEFKEKAITVFESAVVSKINEHIETYNVTVEESFKEDAEGIKTELSEKLDSYLDYVVEQWSEENKVAIEQGLKSELVEDFMGGLKNLFEDHYIDVPDSKVDVVEELAAKNEELEAQLNAELTKNVEAKKAIDESTQQKMIDTVTESLAETQKEKFQTLAEGVQFTDEDSFQKKLSIIKESYFATDTVTETANLVGETDEPLDEEEQPSGSKVDPAMAGYMNAITRSIKK